MHICNFLWKKLAMVAGFSKKIKGMDCVSLPDQFCLHNLMMVSFVLWTAEVSVQIFLSQRGKFNY